MKNQMINTKEGAQARVNNLSSKKSVYARYREAEVKDIDNDMFDDILLQEEAEEEHADQVYLEELMYAEAEEERADQVYLEELMSQIEMEEQMDMVYLNELLM